MNHLYHSCIKQGYDWYLIVNLFFILTLLKNFHCPSWIFIDFWYVVLSSHVHSTIVSTLQFCFVKFIGSRMRHISLGFFSSTSWSKFILFCVPYWMIIINKQIGSPKNPALLGLNVGGGVHVKLRLRRPNRDWDFFPFDQVLDTMLHELCHNAHGPHNATFYKLWDELRKVFLILLSFYYNYHSIFHFL